jgi:hypothetical protein
MKFLDRTLPMASNAKIIYSLNHVFAAQIAAATKAHEFGNGRLINSDLTSGLADPCKIMPLTPAQAWHRVPSVPLCVL